MVKKYILDKKGNLRQYNIKNLKRFNAEYEPTSKIGNRYVYSKPSQIEYQEPIVRRKKVKRIKREKQTYLEDRRIRRGITFNGRSYEEPYAFSITAITINPAITETGLKLAIIETLKEYKFDIDSLWKKEFSIHRETLLGTNEDNSLNDFRVHITIQIRRENPIYLIK